MARICQQIIRAARAYAAIPELLSRLALQGCIVTIDANGCQTNIAQQIIEQKADNLLALKGNQGTLHQDVQSLFDYAIEREFQDTQCLPAFCFRARIT